MTKRDSMRPLWPPAPDAPPLRAGEVHVWRASLLDEAGRLVELQQLLSADERARAERFRFERDSRRYIIARGLLRRLLGLYCSSPPALLRLAQNEHERPELASAAPSAGFDFNISHSQDCALFAFSPDARLGVDLEWIQPLPDMAELVALNFSPSEQASWRALSTDRRERAFFQCWTRKEAFVKAIGEGLSHPLDSFDVLFGEATAAGFERLRGDDPARWSLHALDVGEAYEAAVAVERPAAVLRCWSLDSERGY